MTYNFDPDKWYDNEVAILENKLNSKQISQKEYETAVQILDQKHEEMWTRLNGTYQVIPKD